MIVFLNGDHQTIPYWDKSPFLRNPKTQHQAHPKIPRSVTTHPLTPGGSGTGPERALEAIKPLPSRTARKPQPTPSFPASAGPIPRSPVEALIPSASPGIQPPQNR